ncbi:ABC transporter substrate-binding protein [Paralimibaculum aggregatum]|uniref:ABC transporter substrate-binding protein n=1 Tax=Paralimibaculum aggregatum TaxID=3036245 RepID=A0ABQ6LQK9_9RHOB|nr:ABC transporter substrate-binding protein [Limibaculum sp. NKW23]GMG83219.1 ABC transporter substrate-binding protein [Limibaculum sp. NKW23]
MSNRQWHIRGALAALGMALAGMTGAAGDAAAQEVRVAAITDLTGAYSHVGQKIAATQRLAAEEINAQGGLFADARPLKLVEGDGGCAPEPAVTSAKEILADPEIVSVIGATCSGATLAMAREVAIPAGRVVLSHSATSPAITGLEDQDLVFRTPPSDAYLSVALSGMVHDRYITRVAVTYADDDYNAGVGKAFVEVYQQNGGKVLALEEHTAGETDYRELVDRLDVEGAEALVIFAYYDASGAEIMEAAIRKGKYDTFIGADGMVNEGLIAQVGAENMGFSLFMIAAADDTSEPYRRFAAALESAGLDPTVPFTPHGYDAVYLTALAIEQIGAADPSRMAEALRKVANAPGVPVMPGEWAKAKALIAEGRDIDYLGASGEILFDEHGDTLGLFSVNTAKTDGTWKVEVLR